jgi:hypothetical protein
MIKGQSRRYLIETSNGQADIVSGLSVARVRVQSIIEEYLECEINNIDKFKNSEEDYVVGELHISMS